MNKETIVEVVMKKQMRYGDYLQVIENAKRKGWDISSYQLGYHAEPMNKVEDK